MNSTGFGGSRRSSFFLLAAITLLGLLVSISTFSTRADAEALPSESMGSARLAAAQTDPVVNYSFEVANQGNVSEGDSKEVAVFFQAANNVNMIIDVTVTAEAPGYSADLTQTEWTINREIGAGVTGARSTFIVSTKERTGDQGNRTVTISLSAEATCVDDDGVEITCLLVDPTFTRLTILEDDAAGTATPVYVDRFEPNNTLSQSTSTASGAGKVCGLTLWPSGDIDFFSFVGKRGAAYEVLTSDLSPNLDTVLTIYNTQGSQITSNDDYTFGSLASRSVFSANIDGLYYARVTNKSPADPANQTYCIQINEVQPTATTTPFPSPTRVPGADACEYNGDFDSACLIGSGNTFDMNFVPLFGEGPDNDFYRLWVKPGLLYTCQTLNLSSVNDTNMILYDQNHNGLGGNDDKAPGDFSSQVSWYSTYTGWLYILVGPYPGPPYVESFLYTYSVQCTETVATPTAIPTSTFAAPPGGFVPRPPTATPFLTPTPLPTPVDGEFPTAMPATPTPNIQIIPLPTNTPVAPTQQSVNIDLTVYFDVNGNYEVEITEGVQDVAVAIYDNTTNELLAFGYTNEAGAIRFSSIVAAGPVRVSIPFLQYSQTIIGDSTTFIRVAPYTQQVGQ